MKTITTSWDDGHVLDFKLAALLSKYNLPATFYIPQTNAERPVMGEQEIKELATGFEIGGHTLSHTRLTSISKEFLKHEVGGCYRWLSNLLGVAPASFCFPGGVYDNASKEAVFNAGFSLARTTELFCTNVPSFGNVTATTLQAYPHSSFTYAKHLAKRKRWTLLARWAKAGAQSNLYKLAESFLEQIDRAGGCFHLWGHSWEIEEHNLWPAVENIFKVLANRKDFVYVQNRELFTQSQTSFDKPTLTTTNREK